MKDFLREFLMALKGFTADDSAKSGRAHVTYCPTQDWHRYVRETSVQGETGSWLYAFGDGSAVSVDVQGPDDQAAQLYWADWLADGFGPQPFNGENLFPNSLSRVRIGEGASYD